MAKKKKMPEPWVDEVFMEPFYPDQPSQLLDGIPEHHITDAERVQITDKNGGKSMNSINTRSGSVFTGRMDSNVFNGYDQSDAPQETFLKGARHLPVQRPRKGSGFQLGWGSSTPNESDEEH